MTMQTKIIITVVLLITFGVILNSRRVKQDNFDLIVLMELNEVFEKCNSRLDSNLPKNKRLNYNDSLYNYYIDSQGIEICLCKEDSIKKVIEKNVKEGFEKNWKFVY